MSDEVLLDQAEAETLAIRACRAAGAAQSTARPLDATLSAALFGPATLGFPHMVDYLDSFREGRINCNPTRSRRARIPEGWAVDETGMDTRDAARALAGALLPFGGRKGANVALMVEMLSTGLSGGPWSLDTPSFRSGSASPAVGLTVIAMMPGRPDDGLVERAHRQAARLQQHGVFIPGVDGIEYPKSPSEPESTARGLRDHQADPDA